MPTDELTLTPDDARRLLRQAAGTIEVSASPTDLPSRRRRLPRWLPAIAAAAAVLVIAGGVLVWRALSPDSPPPPSSPPTETTVPAVFGYSREDAVALLEGLGLEVTVREVAGCGEPGRAVKTEPRTGLVADGRVTLEVSGPIAVNLDCAYEPELPLTWALVDFATGRGDAAQIPFADTVEVSYGAGRPREMTAAQAADPASWGPESPLGLLAAATLATRPSEEGGEETPQLINSIGYPTTARCLPTSLPPSPGEKREPVSILVGFDGGSCLTTLDLYFSGPPVGLLPGSRIDKIVGSTPDTVGSSDVYRPGGDPGQAVRIPAVLGLSADEARSVLHGAGFVVHVERIPACDPRGVLDQAPRAGTKRPMGSTVTIAAEVPRRPGRC